MRFVMNIDYTVTALMFPAIPLTISIYSKRFHTLSSLIRKLHDEYIFEKHIPSEWEKQLINLRIISPRFLQNLFSEESSLIRLTGLRWFSESGFQDPRLPTGWFARAGGKPGPVFVPDRLPEEFRSRSHLPDGG